MLLKKEETYKELEDIWNTYYQDGFDKYADTLRLMSRVYTSVGCCFSCEYIQTKYCPLGDSISEVDFMTYYCASYDIAVTT